MDHVNRPVPGSEALDQGQDSRAIPLMGGPKGTVRNVQNRAAGFRQCLCLAGIFVEPDGMLNSAADQIQQSIRVGHKVAAGSLCDVFVPVVESLHEIALPGLVQAVNIS